MKLSYSWLKEFLPHLTATPFQIAEKLGSAGFEIESITSYGSDLSHVVVACVVDIIQHPQADRLKLCQVDTGHEVLTIVCGASNVEKGKKYPLAMIGATLPGGLVIKKASLRGIESFGMLCSEQELGLAESAAGLYLIPDSVSVGTSISDYLGDTILDVSTPPNRGDVLSHWGLAREVAAQFDLKIKMPELPAEPSSTQSFLYASRFDIKVVDVKSCKAYFSQIIEGVKVQDSPEWLVRRLKSLGLRSVNNIVDATNYVMMELGHPVHAFDRGLLQNSQLQIKSLSSSLPFVTIDHNERMLEPGDLVICDGDTPVALAGIMGGANSEVGPSTKTLVLEVASFEPDRIRKTARRLGIKTDSSYRFERGVDPSSLRLALQRLTSLIIQLSGGVASQDIFEFFTGQSPVTTVSLSLSKLQTIVGEVVSAEEVIKIFESLSLSVKYVDQTFAVTPPSFRTDLLRDVDLIEEYVRFKGFDSITSRLPSALHRPVKESPDSACNDSVKKFFKHQGFVESIHYSFTSWETLQKWDPEIKAVSLANPLNPELAVLRPELLPDLLADAARYSHFYKAGFRLYELRTVFSNLGQEHRRLSGVYSGQSQPHQWHSQPKTLDFFYGKGLIELLLAELRVSAELQATDTLSSSSFHPFQQVAICLNGKTIGHIGKIHPQILSRFALSHEIYAFDLDYSTLALAAGKHLVKFESYSDRPGVGRDMALVLDRSISFSQVLAAIQSQKIAWLKEIKLFDVYKGEKIPAEKQSMALSLTYESEGKTLTDEEVNKVHFGLIDKLGNLLGAELRGS